jgi:hypothetical protein
MRDSTEREVASGILGEESRFRLIVAGPYAPAQIQTIIRHAQIVRDVMAVDETVEREFDAEWAE